MPKSNQRSQNQGKVSKSSVTALFDKLEFRLSAFVSTPSNSDLSGSLKDTVIAKPVRTLAVAIPRIFKHLSSKIRKIPEK